MQGPICNEISKKLLDVMKSTGYPIVQNNGQRIFGPPSDWIGAPPPRGCEVFVGKLPRNIYEDELVPIFLKVGKIYMLRLMMDFSGSNRGYAFVCYATRAEASAAIKQLNNYEIRPRRHIGVVESVDNCRLFIGNIPKHVTKAEVLKELSDRVTGIVQVIMYENCFYRNQNRGYAFVEFVSHRAAAMARRVLVPGCIRIWNRDIMVDWAEPEPEVDDDQMERVKILYARNFGFRTTHEKIQALFEGAIKTKIEKVKKINDYAFIHFYERKHAAQALTNLQNAELDGYPIQLKWAKPVNSELYHIQKLRRGNAKFNLNYPQTLLSYKQHLDNMKKANSLKDEGMGSSYAPDCFSPIQNGQYQQDVLAAPASLHSLCNRYLWTQPHYKFQPHFDAMGNENWVCLLELSHVGSPLFHPPRRLGPLYSSPCLTYTQAQCEVATTALRLLKQQQDLVHPIGRPVYQPMVPAAQPYIQPWEYVCPTFYPAPPLNVPVTVPPTW